jgi:hypothetical protein
MILKIEESTLQTIKNQTVWKKYYWLERVSIALLINITYGKYSSENLKKDFETYRRICLKI